LILSTTKTLEIEMEDLNKRVFLLDNYPYGITRNIEFNAIDDFIGYDGKTELIIKFLQELGYERVDKFEGHPIYYHNEKYQPVIQLWDNFSSGNRQIKYLLVGPGRRSIFESKIWYSNRKRAD